MVVDENIVGIVVALVGLILAYSYDRGRRYNYLADRWNDLMSVNLDEPDFFDSAATVGYQNFERGKRTKYSQHARIYWGVVEDIVRNEYFFERRLPWPRVEILESFVDAYSDTIRDCIRLHHAWLKDNKDRLFTYGKFRSELRKRFGDDLQKVGLEL